MKKLIRSGTIAAILSALLMTQAFAAEIPIEQTEREVNGQQTLVQVYEVPASTDPETLYTREFEKNGFYYELNGVVKDVDTETTKKDITQVMELTLSAKTEASAREEAIKYMRPSVEYDDGEFTGTLYVIPGSLQLAPVNERTVYGSRTVTKQYTMEYNDDSEIPQAVSDGGYNYSISSINWQEGDMGEDGAMPENYIATAVYSRRTSSVVNDGYTATVEYAGTVGHEAPETVRYTVTYYGYPIVVEEPSFLDKLTGDTESRVVIQRPGSMTTQQDAPQQEHTARKVNWDQLLSVLLVLAVVAALTMTVTAVLRYIILTSVVVYARDEHSGEDHRIQTSHLSKRKLAVDINYLKAPESRHFTVSIKRKFAGNLLGKVLTIQAGKKVIKHTVTQCYGDVYQIPIEVD